MTFFLVVILTALVFEYTNGFHDTANAIATVVSTKVLTPRWAIAVAAVANLVGALSGTAVASMVGKGMVDTHAVHISTVFGALIAAIAWNLFTWWLGLPSSSSHALIGGLCGATLASAGGDWGVLQWSTGLWPKVILPMLACPLVGFVGGALFMGTITWSLRRASPRFVGGLFRWLQRGSSAFMGYAHGSNDAQKTMGIITLSLYTATHAGIFNRIPAWAGFLRVDEFKSVPLWVILVCAVTMAAGTAAGGWRIIHTMGQRVVSSSPRRDSRRRRPPP